MSYGELLEWHEFYTLDPFDEARGDLRNAMLMSLLANVNRDRKKHPKAISFTDFMPFHDAEKNRMAAVERERAEVLHLPKKVKVDPALLTYMFVASGVKPPGTKG